MKASWPLTVVLAAAIGLGMCGSLRASDTDDRIESSAKKTYVFRTYLKDDHIKVHAKDGVVTLTGTVTDESHKALAEDTVKGLPGVNRIDNQIEVKGQKPAAMSDDWISAKVKAALLFHRSVSAKTQVYVKDGVVTLKGAASSQAEKDLATQYAKDIEGVKDVVNQMTIVASGPPDSTMGEKIDDASITAQVKTALLTHRSTSALKTDVDTKDGVVTLKGTAKSMAEKDLAEKLTKDIHGVKSVRNEITVQG